MTLSPTSELIAEVRNFLISIHGDIRKVKLSVWTPEQFVLNMGLQTDKMEKYLRDVDGSHDNSKGNSTR
jgi:hypothetical protein